MKKNKKDLGYPRPTKRTKILIGILIVTLLALPVWLAAPSIWYLAYGRLEAGNKLASATQMGDSIIASIEDMHADAPVKPETGDTYFPEERLYLPRPVEAVDPLRLKYDRYVDENGQNAMLSITSHEALSDRISKFRNATTVEEVFERVPMVQACARGIQLHYSAQTITEAGLKHTLTLGNGKTIFMYLDNGCPELGKVADQLAGIRSY